PGKCIYGVYLDESGHVIDDAILYRIDEKNYITVVNSGMGGQIAAHLVKYADDLKVEISDLTEKTGKLDIQGPLAGKILRNVLKDPETVLENFRFFTLKGHFDTESPLSDTVRLADGTPVLLSRTGYTGEFGFEVFMDPVHLVKTWEMILEAGKPFGLIPCGLAARDSLRTGALLPLSHQDIGSWPFIHNPWCFALPYTADQTGFTKTFVGDQALLSVENPEYTYAFAGYDLRKISVSDGAVVLDTGEKKIGTVLTCVTDMAIGRYKDRIYSITSPDKPENFVPKGLSCGFVKVKSKIVPGRTVYLKDNRRKIKVAIVEDIRPDRTAMRPIREMI
ncbi:MAG: aminomethyl transferase family protein, partial [Deltaproteobacteria bacterium]|nr:aminomethyl transferase family protein [Deltaproteobacteria bacterium]